VAFLYLLMAAIVVVGGVKLIRALQRPQPTSTPESEPREDFREHSQLLLETGRLEELVAYARDRIAKRPNHTYAHWYLGRALYLQQKWSEALAAFNEVARLDPSWIEDSVTPYVRAIEANLRPKDAPAAPDNSGQRTLH
jgi:cytochrome c-type biogenesis protein CcmH/NrfG